MTQASDPVTVALTGHVPFDLLLAAAITWPMAMVILRLYTRAVRRSMRSHAPAATSEATTSPLVAAGMDGSLSDATSRATLHDLPDTSPNPATDALLSRLIARPRRAAFVYAVGGTAFGLV